MSYPEAIDLIDAMIRETEDRIARIDKLLGKGSSAQGLETPEGE